MSVQLSVTAEDERTARNVAREMRAICGGESLVISPEEYVEKIRLALPSVSKIFPTRPSVPRMDHYWRVEWNSDPTISVLDRWRCEGWSQRVGDLILGLGCKLTGWSVRPTPS